jgi:AhpD family alkylhydroperoxidase
MKKRIDRFHEHRARMNEKILATDFLPFKRFFSLDTTAYQEGALGELTKELMGLVASTVLRCDDCITYHLERCMKLGVKMEELYEALNIALIVGGSITIPHLRRAFETIEELEGLRGEE